MSHHQPEESYAGPATLVHEETRIEVTVRLRGHVEPIDGRFHWYGRIGADAHVAALGSGATVTLATGTGEATGRLSDVDPWGRFRITGVGRPPF